MGYFGRVIFVSSHLRVLPKVKQYSNNVLCFGIDWNSWIVSFKILCHSWYRTPRLVFPISRSHWQKNYMQSIKMINEVKSWSVTHNKCQHCLNYPLILSLVFDRIKIKKCFIQDVSRSKCSSFQLEHADKLQLSTERDPGVERNGGRVSTKQH